MLHRAITAALALCCAAVANASPFAYVPGSGAGVVTVIDTATDSVVTTVAVGGSFAQGVAVNAAGTRAYVSNLDTHTLSVIDAFTNTVIATIPLGTFPSGFPVSVAVSPDGTRVYASTHATGSVTVVDATTNTVLTEIFDASIDGPQNLVVTPDGAKVYVTNVFGGANVTVIDSATNTVIAAIPAAATRGIDVHPDGSKVYAADSDGFPEGVAVIDTATDTLITKVPLPDATAVRVSPDGSKVYVGSTGVLSVIDTATNLVVASVPTGFLHFGIDVTPSGNKIYLADLNFSTNAVAVFDTSLTPLGVVPVLGDPFARGRFIGPAFTCGDGTVNPGEACDDGNNLSGDCCSSTCQLETGSPCADEGNECTDDLCNASAVCGHVPNSNTCNDNNACTTGEVCSGGFCGGGAAVDCDDGRLCTQDSCDSGTGCINDPAPTTGCSTSQKSLLLIKDKTDNDKDALLWKFIKGAPTSQAQFGDPSAATDYALCIYTGAANNLFLEAAIPSGTEWTPLGAKGYGYSDASGAHAGIRRILLKGSDQSKTKVLVKASGGSIPDVTLGAVAAPIKVQLLNTSTAACWESDFGAGNILKNETELLKAKATY